MIIATALFGLVVGIDAGSGGMLDRPPRVSDLTARMGPVPLQGGGTKRGVKGTYRLCDDGPAASTARFALEEITHRWRTRAGGDVSLLVRERHPSTSWDVYFRKPECRSRIFWNSTLPTDVRVARTFPCYSVSLRVRDPGGSWSRAVTHVVERCG